MKYPVVTICGSMRFYRDMLRIAEFWTAHGWVVLMPFVAKSDTAPIADPEMLDEMHRQKIDMADRVAFYTGPEDYMGESTTAEWEYTIAQGKEVERGCW
jgi:hypothetical protein